MEVCFICRLFLVSLEYIAGVGDVSSWIKACNFPTVGHEVWKMGGFVLLLVPESFLLDGSQLRSSPRWCERSERQLGRVRRRQLSQYGVRLCFVVFV